MSPQLAGDLDGCGEGVPAPSVGAGKWGYILYNPWYVTLEEELVYTQNFIDMQSAQHDERYRYAVQVEDALLDSEIPILGIQIFVEKSSRNLIIP